MKGASVHTRNKFGHTPLYLAAETGSKANVQMLREAGAHLHPQELGNLKASNISDQVNGTLEAESSWDLALQPTHSH